MTWYYQKTDVSKKHKENLKKNSLKRLAATKDNKLKELIKKEL